ncbi:RNA processing protein [Geranomyces variabilis]|nr:RNA processing protein [Geranomyces variabilis]
MLPLSLLNTAQGHPMLVELKNGETYNGHLTSCDNFMNINLREVIHTSPDGDRFHRLAEIHIRGSTIKYLRVPDEVIDMVREDARNHHSGGGGGGGGNGGRGGRGGGGRGTGAGGARGGYRGGRGGRGRGA